MDFPDPKLSNLSIPLELLNKVSLLGCSDDFSVDCTAPGAEITDFNIWDKALTFEEATKWTTCDLKEEGNILSWSNSSWTLKNVASDSVSSDKLCDIKSLPADVLFPERRTMPDHRLLCNTMKGTVAVAEDQEATRSLVEKFYKGFPEFRSDDSEISKNV